MLKNSNDGMKDSTGLHFSFGLAAAIKFTGSGRCGTGIEQM